MLCDGCKKREASMMLHMITNGQLATRSLCPECAKKAHGEMAQAFSTMGIRMEGLNGMVEQQAAPQEAIRLPKMICASCRTPYEDIDHDTVFGCPNCYQAFHQMVIDYLSGLQEIAVFDTDVQEVEKQEPSRKAVLERRIQEAVQQENYEQAAILRDELNELKEGAEEIPDA